MGLGKAGWNNQEHNLLAQDRDKWQYFVNMVMNSEISGSCWYKYEVFWNVAPYSLVEMHQCFRGTYWLSHQGDESG